MASVYILDEMRRACETDRRFIDPRFLVPLALSARAGAMASLGPARRGGPQAAKGKADSG